MIKNRTKLLVVVAIVILISGCHSFRVTNGQQPYPFQLIESQLDTSATNAATKWVLIEYSENTSRRKRHVLYTPSGRKYLELTLENSGPSYVWYDEEWGTVKRDNYEQILFQIKEIWRAGSASTSIIKML